MSPNGNLDTAPLCQTEDVRLRDCETPESNSYLSLLLGSGIFEERRKELKDRGKRLEITGARPIGTLATALAPSPIPSRFPSWTDQVPNAPPNWLV